MSVFTISGLLSSIRSAIGTPTGDSLSEMIETILEERLTETRAGYLDLINTNLDAKVSESVGGKRRAAKLTSGSSWTHPDNVKDNFVLVTLVGGGGAGGRDSSAGEGGAGGGGGETLFRVPYIISGSSTAITVAAAKAGRATDGIGDTGDSTTFGTLTAAGGVGGGNSAAGSPPPGGSGGGIYGGTGSGLQATRGDQLGWRIGGGEGGNGDDASGGAPQAGGYGISDGGAADAANNCGGGGGSWGGGGPGLTGGGSSCNGTDGGGGGGCRSGTSGAGGAGFIIVEWEEADASASETSGPEFLDSLFRILDNSDPTKQIDFDASAITTGTKRTITMPDADVDLGKLRKEVLIIAVGDESTAITTGTAKVTFRMPFAMTLTAVRASLSVVSSSGTPTFDINESGSTILSTKLTIDASEKTSTTAASAAVISDTSLADDAEMTIDIDVAGTGAAGPKIYLIGYAT